MTMSRPLPVTITLWLGWAWTFIVFSNLGTIAYLGYLWFLGLALTGTALLGVFYRIRFSHFYLSAVFVVWLIALGYVITVSPKDIIGFSDFRSGKVFRYCLAPLLGLVLINLPSSRVWLRGAIEATEEAPPKAATFAETGDESIIAPPDWVGIGQSFLIYTLVYGVIVVPAVMFLVMVLSFAHGSEPLVAKVISALPVMYIVVFVLLRFRSLRAAVFRNKVSPAMILIPLFLGGLAAWFLMLSIPGRSILWSFL
jgi:hypothetical protein